MGSIEELTSALTHGGLDLVGPVIEDLDNESTYIAFLKVSRSKSGKQTPSNFRISQIEREIEHRYGPIVFVLVIDGDDDIKGTIKSVVLRRFGDDVRNVVSSVDGSNVSVWIDPKRTLDKERSSDIVASVKEAINLLGLRTNSITSLSDLNLPSLVATLNTVRQKAPIDLEGIGQNLKERGFQYPNADWLGHRLDRLRKQKVIIRKRDGRYIMTLEGLKVLGSTKNSRSPDVRRSLDMARRSG